nr:Ger(x)C family spore germination protein [Cohnella lupini]
MRKSKTLYLVFTSLLLCSCNSEHIIDKLTMVLTASYDLNDNKIENNVLIGEYTEQDKTNIIFRKTTSNNNYEIITHLNTQMNKPIAYGQMRMILFGQAFARKGIGDVINILSRDAEISSHLQLAVSSDKPEDIMRATIETHDPLYLMRMIEQNYINENLPNVNLHTHVFNYYGQGQDIYIPTFKLTPNESVEIDGIALFKKDKDVHHLSIDECIWLKLLLQNAKSGTFAMTKEHNENILIHIDSSKNKMKLIQSNPQLIIQDRLKINASIKNISEEIPIRKKQQLDELEKELEEYVRNNIEKLTKKLQSLKVDPVGFGRFTRSRDRKWNENEFYRQYDKQFTFNLDVEIKLNQIGTED